MFDFIKSLFGSSAPALSAKDLLEGTVIDVRTPAEYAQGHAKSTVNIPLNLLDKNLERIRKMPQPIFTCCKSGARSAMAGRQLKAAGLETRNLGAWQKVDRILQRKG